MIATSKNSAPQPGAAPMPATPGERTEIVRVQGLSKRYAKKGNWAIEDITFSCYAGEIVGLLGHNGAGKSTTLKCLENMLPYEKGELSICGYDVQKQALQAKANMGFVTDNHAVFVKMTGLQYLAFMADVYGVPTERRQGRLEQLEGVFQLGDAVNNLISSYSHGMRQKICMMGSLMHTPKLWILDEPMTGLDPRTMRAVQDYMRAYAAQGNTIIFSSHDLHAVSKICHRVVLISKGKLVEVVDIPRWRAEHPGLEFEEYFLGYEAKD